MTGWKVRMNKTLGCVLCTLGVALASLAQAQEQPELPPVQGELVPAQGPWGGLVYEVRFGPGPGGVALYALAETGVWRWGGPEEHWLPVPVGAPEDPLTSALPVRVDPAYMAHLEVGDEPTGVELMVQERGFYLRNHSDGFFCGSVDKPWAPCLDVPQGLRLSSWAGDSPGQAYVLGAARGDGGASTLWWRRAGESAWQERSLEGRAVLASVARGRVGASWRSGAPSGGQVDHFVRLQAPPDGGEPTEEVLDWQAALRASGEQARRLCADATDLLEVARPGEAKAFLVALGPGAVCVSTDGGRRFTPRHSFWEDARPNNKPGEASAAVAFVHEGAPAGVRLLVGTRGGLRSEAPTTRARGGQIFLSDDGGQTWLDATPDIDAPGGVVSLAAGPWEGGTQVWAVWARRGVFRSTQAGLGFEEQVQGLAAVPIHEILRDPVISEEVWAASPQGLLHFSGGWRRSAGTAARSLGARPATPSHLGQLWVGTWFGGVLWRNQRGSFQAEILPPRPALPGAEEATGEPEEDTSAALSPLAWRVTRGEFWRQALKVEDLRPVVMVAPAGFDEGGADTGYALVRGEGILRRQGAPEQPWSWLPWPVEGAAEVAALVAAPLPQGREGGLLLVSQARAEGVVGRALLHIPGQGWVEEALPVERAPRDAVRVQGVIWVSSLAGEVYPIRTNQGRVMVGEPLKGSGGCGLLSAAPQGGLSCLVEPEGARGDQALGRVLRWEREALLGNRAPRATALSTREALPRGAARVRSLTWSRNDTGAQLWAATRVGVWASPRALEPALPREPERSPLAGWDRVLPFALAGLAALALIFFLLLWRRRRVSRLGAMAGEKAMEEEDDGEQGGAG